MGDCAYSSSALTCALQMLFNLQLERKKPKRTFSFCFWAWTSALVLGGGMCLDYLRLPWGKSAEIEYACLRWSCAELKWGGGKRSQVDGDVGEKEWKLVVGSEVWKARNRKNSEKERAEKVSGSIATSYKQKARSLRGNLYSDGIETINPGLDDDRCWAIPIKQQPSQPASQQTSKQAK
ncbi:uncharacterized protein An18g06330 [Aspergillus niger]|uniref:Contig An18c0190, genomic contig n=2 Tax=Aspergillus niger TaxID=5061 RepID=A2RBD4_ASPNC|nr:uncharacterized protein An18g06330 [Aspergillus niger]CAK43358.1 unnamed protein product [Aspergillus niger]